MKTLMSVLVLTGLAACATGDSGYPASGDIANGEALYIDTCGACHASPSSLAGHPPAMLTDVITNGTGSMPAQSQLSEQDVADIVAYLGSL